MPTPKPPRDPLSEKNIAEAVARFNNKVPPAFDYLLNDYLGFLPGHNVRSPLCVAIKNGGKLTDRSGDNLVLIPYAGKIDYTKMQTFYLNLRTMIAEKKPEAFMSVLFLADMDIEKMPADILTKSHEEQLAIAQQHPDFREYLHVIISKSKVADEILSFPVKRKEKNIIESIGYDPVVAPFKGGTEIFENMFKPPANAKPWTNSGSTNVFIETTLADVFDFSGKESA